MHAMQHNATYHVATYSIIQLAKWSQIKDD
jgi:hypothetical protein